MILLWEKVMEWVLIIITSYGLNVDLKISELIFQSETACVETMIRIDETWKKEKDQEFSYTMRCEGRKIK